MRDLVEVIVKALVDSPEEVVVTEKETEKGLVVEIKVAEDDKAKLSVKIKELDAQKSSLMEEISNIKAIYGPNGAGKTAIILSMNLYKRIVTDYMYLLQDDVMAELNSYINKKIKKFYISVVFSVLDQIDNKNVEK